MSRTPPRQKPGRSTQTYATPHLLVTRVKQLLNIGVFTVDLAADWDNTKAHVYFDEAQNSLTQNWPKRIGRGWGWLNPPFAHIEPWAKKCWETSQKGGRVALLVPASVGSQWFKQWVWGKSRVVFLQGRPAFDPAHPTWGYPKDCMLCLYGPEVRVGFSLWSWMDSEVRLLNAHPPVDTSK